MNRRKRSNTAGARFTSQVNKNKYQAAQTRQAINRRANAKFNEGTLKGRKLQAAEEFSDLTEAINRQRDIKKLDELIANTRKNRAAKKKFRQKMEREVAANKARQKKQRQDRGPIYQPTPVPQTDEEKKFREDKKKEKKKRQLSKADVAFLEKMNSRRFSDEFDLKLKL